MNFQDKILNYSKKHKKIKALEVAQAFGVTRQYASQELNKLVKQGLLRKFGSTKSSFYTLPHFSSEVTEFEVKLEKKLKNKDLQEHIILDQALHDLDFLHKAPENVRSIFAYAFSEMLNNAIDHSDSEYIDIKIAKIKNQLFFSVTDSGVGVFRNVKRKMKLPDEKEALLQILKGKTTTQPRAHSGEGIFFTSKIADLFILESFGEILRVDTKMDDLFIQKEDKETRGTKVSFYLDLDSKKHLNDVFKEFQIDNDDFGFNKTEVKVRLYSMGTIYVSRSQAKRILNGLEKFELIILDFDKVPTVGQAFVDEIFRVFKNKYPKIKIEPINMNEAVEFMVKRSIQY